MKKMILLAGYLLLPAVFAADLSANLTFAADYRAGKIDAEAAKGNPKAKVTLAAQLEFSAQGLVVGKGKAALRYETAGNLNAGSGAIEILFENTDLNWNDKSKLILVQSISKGLTFYIYKHSDDGLGAYFGNREPKWTAFPRATAPRLGGKKLYHLVINYSAEKVECYVDGKLMRSIKVAAAPAEFGKYFSVGPAGTRFGCDAVCTIAKVAAYNRPLTGAEIAELAKQ